MLGEKTNPVVRAARDTFDSFDVHSWAISWHFAVADQLEGYGAVPEEWDFTQSFFGPDTEAYEYQAIEELLDSDTGTNADQIAMLQKAGWVFGRLALLTADEDV